MYTPPPIFSFSHIINGFLKSHKLDECNELFVTGGPYTTPHLTIINPCIPSPWRSACLFIVMLTLCTGFLLVEQYARIELGNVKLFLAAVTVGNVFAPLSLVLLLSELNLWRNIQVLRLGYQIAGGGLLSIVFALFMYQFSHAESPMAAALCTGTVEEVAKVMACVALAGPVLRNGRILNGMLIGAAIGAGFSLIESMGYTFESLMEYPNEEEGLLSYQSAMSTMGMRALFAMTAGHVMWGAISGGALWGFHNHRRLRHALHQPKFLLVLLFCIGLHSGWNICCYTGIGLSMLPLLSLLTWVALFIIVYQGIKQIRARQRLWFDTSSETEEIFSTRGEDGVWKQAVTAARLLEMLEAEAISRNTPCRVGDCTIPVPVWHLSFVTNPVERLCTWWRTPRCHRYKICFVLGATQLLSLAAGFIRPEAALPVIIFALALLGEIVLHLSWVLRLWQWSLRRFPQNDAEMALAGYAPQHPGSLWVRLLIPIYNFAWGYQLYVQIVRRFNATGLHEDRIPLWIPRFYWGNIVAAFVLLVTMALLHQGEANMWHFLLLVLLYPVFAFFMSRALNCIHQGLKHCRL